MLHFFLLQKVMKSCRRMAQKLSCMTAPFEPPYDPVLSSPFLSSSLPTAAGSSETTRTHTASGSRTPAPHGKGPAGPGEGASGGSPGPDRRYHAPPPPRRTMTILLQRMRLACHSWVMLNLTIIWARTSFPGLVSSFGQLDWVKTG